MDAPLSLTLLYSANIAGDLALLPRLYTFLQRLIPAGAPKTLLLDLGGSCSASVWHCRATANRSTLIALDGMGYHAANVQGTLDAETRNLLAAQVTLALVDRGRHWRCALSPRAEQEIVVALSPVDRAAALQVLLEPAESTRLEDNVLRLQALHAGQVGQVTIAFQAEPRIASAFIQAMPPDTAANPSIAGAVDFVLSEARLYRQKQAGEKP
ncbi:MAG: hypothetical protein OXG78_04645 [Chloroflexi bacterium]|nr:hypothetical protein [Chloroflexota bacterium]